MVSRCEDQGQNASLQHKSVEGGHRTQTWFSCPDSTSRTSDQSVTETDGKKRKKKRKKEDSMEVLGKDNDSGLNDGDGVSSCKKRKKAHKDRKHNEQVQGRSDKKNGVQINTSVNDITETAICDDGRSNASVDLQLDIGQTDLVRKDKNDSDAVDNQANKSTESLKQSCDDQSVKGEKSSPSSEKENQKKNKRRRRKRKKTFESSVFDVGVDSHVSNQVTPPISAHQKKHKKVLNTHKHFRDSEEEGDQSECQTEENQLEGIRGDKSEDEVLGNDKAVPMSHYNSYTEKLYGSNEETDSSIHQADTMGCGSRNNVSVRETILTNGTSVFTRKRKWKFPELTKEQQLATMATNKSVIIQVCRQYSFVMF